MAILYCAGGEALEQAAQQRCGCLIFGIFDTRSEEALNLVQWEVSLPTVVDWN